MKNFQAAAEQVGTQLQASSAQSTELGNCHPQPLPMPAQAGIQGSGRSNVETNMAMQQAVMMQRSNDDAASSDDEDGDTVVVNDCTNGEA